MNTLIKMPTYGILEALFDGLRTAGNDFDLSQVYAGWAFDVLGAKQCCFSVKIDELTLESRTLTAGRSNVVRVSHGLEGSPIGEAFLDRTPRIISNLAQRKSPGCRTLAASGVATIIVAPLSTGQQCYGVISACFESARAASTKDLEMLRAFAGFLASQIEMRRDLSEFKHLSQTDPLMGAHNRNSFAVKSAALWMDWITLGKPFSFAMVDLDHFKMVNDSMGHSVGDLVLCETVHRLQSQLRKGDIVVRMGGEEFCILICGVSAKGAAPLVDRLHKSIGQTPIQTSEGPVTVTASIGLTSPCELDKGYECLLKRSDKALYIAKAEGRNAVIALEGEALNEVGSFSRMPQTVALRKVDNENGGSIRW